MITAISCAHFLFSLGTESSCYQGSFIYGENNKKIAKMVKKSKLFAALDAHKGRDYEKERQKKLAKAAEKKKKAQKGESEEAEEVCCSALMQFNCVC